MNEQPKNNKTSIIIALLSIVVLIQAIKIFLDYRERKEVKQQLEVITTERDHTVAELKLVKIDLDNKIAEVKKLGGDIEDLTKAHNEVVAELKKNKSRSASALKELNSRIDGYRELLLHKDKEIAKLKAANEDLVTQVTELKTTQSKIQTKLGDSINNLLTTKQKLQEKVNSASQLRAENIAVTAMNDRGKERKSPFRNRQIAKLKIQFTLADNKITDIGGQKIFWRIINNKNGQVIFDVNKGSGTFIVNGKEEFYTVAQEILFDNTKQQVSLMFEKVSDYPSGEYTAELYARDYIIGTSKFSVK